MGRTVQSDTLYDIKLMIITNLLIKAITYPLKLIN